MANIRVFTFNMRTDAPSDGVNWFSGERSAYIGKTFPKYRADIIGCQETTPCMRQWLIDHFHEYEVCGLGREADLQGESNVVCFRREKFDLVTLDQFWLSDTPHVPGSRFHTDQSECPRICMALTLRSKENGRLFRYYNTHLDHAGELAQAQGMSLILERMTRDYGAWQLPVILTGDLNITPASKTYRSLVEFTGCGTPLRDLTTEVGPTLHNYMPKTVHEKIDYIFTNLPHDPSKTVKATDHDDAGHYLSDHYPVGAEILLD